MKTTSGHRFAPAALFRFLSSLSPADDGRRGRVSLDDFFQPDNAGMEYHETKPRLLTEKDVFYLCVIGVLIAIWLGK